MCCSLLRVSLVHGRWLVEPVDCVTSSDDDAQLVHSREPEPAPPSRPGSPMAVTETGASHWTEVIDVSRFEVQPKDGTYLVRASQGHSVSHVRDDLILTALSVDDTPEYAAHGTYYDFYESILRLGIVAGGRRRWPGCRWPSSGRARSLTVGALYQSGFGCFLALRTVKASMKVPRASSLLCSPRSCGQRRDPAKDRFQFPTLGKSAVDSSVWKVWWNLVKPPDL